MSCSMALRRSPKPGALTAATLRPPRSLLTTSVASASPSTSSAMITQRLGALHHGFQQRQQLLQAGELLLVDQDVGVLHLDPHLLGIGDEVGRDVAAVELHAFDHLELGLQRLRLLDRDHALVADLLHGVGEEAADLGVAVGRDGADLGDLLVGGDLLGVLLQVGDDRLDRQIDAALEVHRVHAGGDRLGAFPHDRVGQHGRGGGAVTGLVGGLGGDLAHHLGAHVLELVLELDLLGDGDAVLGDARRAVATCRARRCGPWGRASPAPHWRECRRRAASGRAHRPKISLPWQTFWYLLNPMSVRVLMRRAELGIVAVRRSRPGAERGLRDAGMRQAAFFLASVSTSTPMMSLSFMIRYSTPSILTSVPDHLPNSTRSPALTSIGMSLPASSRPPGPTATTLALLRLLLGGVRNDDAAGGLVLGVDFYDSLLGRESNSLYECCRRGILTVFRTPS